jgi:hypothetical protein
MKRYLLSKKARLVIRALLIAVVMAAAAAQSLPAWAQSAELKRGNIVPRDPNSHATIDGTCMTNFLPRINVSRKFGKGGCVPTQPLISSSYICLINVGA